VKQENHNRDKSQSELELTIPSRNSRVEADARPVVPAQSDSAKQKNEGNKRGYFRVVTSLAEFHPHPSASPVELAGRIRDLQSLRTSSGNRVSFFVLFDSSAYVRVFVPWERVGQTGEPLTNGDRVLVRGKVRVRNGKKVCDALEVMAVKGGISNGETTPDQSAKGDP
jgi:DNA polymerase III alpha subunit